MIAPLRNHSMHLLVLVLVSLGAHALAAAEGFQARYYANTTLSGAPAVTRVDATINFNWGSGSPGTGIPADNFSVRWTGYLTPPESGIWTFTTASDDGVSLMVAGRSIVRDGTAHAVKEHSGSIELQAGVPVLVEMTYYEAGGQAVAQLYWSGPTTTKQVVPTSAVQPASSPLLFAGLPATSEVSPAFIEARSMTVGPLALTAHSVPVALTVNGTHAYGNVVLNPALPTPVQLSVGTQVESQEVTWQPIVLEGGKSRTVRVGDSLLLQASVAGTWRTIRGSGVGAGAKACKPGDRFPVSFNQAGIYEMVAFNVSGAEVGSLIVNVMSVEFGKIACEVGFKREKEIKVLGGDFASLAFTSADPLVVDITPKGPTTEGGDIYVQPFRRGTPVVYARVGGPVGPILAAKEIDEFTLANTARPGGLVNEDTSLTSATLTITPFIPDLWFNFSMFAHKSTFKGGAKAFTINTSDALSGLGEPGFTTTVNASGETVGQFLYTLEVPPGETKTCLRAIPQQINSPPKDVGYSTGYNGCWCRVSAEHIELKEGETKPLEINVVKACVDGSVYQTITTAGSTGDSPPYARGNVDCKVPGPVAGINVDCSNFKVNAVPPNGPYPGKYTLYIGGAKWEDLIWVYPGCTARPAVRVEGSITKEEGEVYSDGANFTPPSTQLSFLAKGIDMDMCNEKPVNDTFNKNGAFEWRSNVGTITKQDEIVRRIKWAAPAAAELAHIRVDIKDDGTYAQDPDRAFYTYDVAVYQLTGIKVTTDTGNVLQSQQRLTASSAVEVTAIENCNGLRPTLEYYFVDEHGVETPFTTGKINKVRIPITSPGRYRFGVRNTKRTVEQFESSAYAFFTLGFEEAGGSFHWDPTGLDIQGLGSLRSLGETIEQNVQRMQSLATVGKASASTFVLEFPKLLNKVDAEIRANNSQITELGRQNAADEERRQFWEANARQAALDAERSRQARDAAVAAYRAAPSWSLFQAMIQAELRYFLDSATLTNSRRLATEAAQRITQRAAEITRLRNLTTLWSEFVAEVRAVRNVENMRAFGEAFKAKAIAKNLFTIVGVAFDVASIYDSCLKVQDLYDAWGATKEQIDQYNALLKALRSAERIKGPETVIMTVVSDPDDISFKFNLADPDFVTHDRNLGAAKNESMWNFQYLAEIDGDIKGWKETHKTTYGRNTFALTLWGNLGSHKIGLEESDENYMLTSTGLTEQELVAAAEEALNHERMLARFLKETVNIIFNAAQVILAAIGTFFVWTGVVPLVMAAIELALEVLENIWNWLMSFVDGSELIDSIRSMWPWA